MSPSPHSTEGTGPAEGCERAEACDPAAARAPKPAAGGEPRELEIGSELAGARLDRALASLLGASRRQVRALLGSGAVMRNDRRAELGHKGDPVAEGDRLTVEQRLPPALAQVIPQPELPLVVLASGPGWLAVDKPAGVPVHPLQEGETGTILNALVARQPEVQGVGEAGLRSGVVHRLDVETSGVLLLASRPLVWERLRGAFREHRVEKVYRAIVRGEFTREGLLEVGLAVAQHRPARVRVVVDDAHSAEPAGVTAARRNVWRVEQRMRALESLRGATLVEVRPRTGFLHQIRATLAHLGHPVLGDATYGPRSNAPGGSAAQDSGGARRHMLHAAAATLDDDIHAEAEDPPDFAALLERLRGPSNSRSPC